MIKCLNDPKINFLVKMTPINEIFADKIYWKWRAPVIISTWLIFGLI